jgi:predicted transcriptional regulator
MKKLLKLPKPEKREKPLTLRLTPSCVEKLTKLASAHSATRTDVIEYLVARAYDQTMEKAKRR